MREYVLPHVRILSHTTAIESLRELGEASDRIEVFGWGRLTCPAFSLPPQ